ncbi:hypothetical protein [Micromonospora sp. NPDC051006]|uniref:hypothetical protein n=1 Tax=Micromonospora sp. NPDC051006 TaxID=3364283 RepID=UPI0037AFB7F8
MERETRYAEACGAACQLTRIWADETAVALVAGGGLIAGPAWAGAAVSWVTATSAATRAMPNSRKRVGVCAIGVLRSP